ncbi:MAG: cytochrome c nitrite reductase small subunit [Thermoanaerobaculaceae bacterium]|nr:cytochrome c nitrite reductase small subunit [Thermoanaerobaculaceae bacterium]
MPARSRREGGSVKVDAMVRVGLVAAAAVGLAGGLGFYTFVYARGGSYLTNDPAACANCHIMREHFEGWLKGPHRHVAVCNDCHTPHNLVGKYAVKASNGFWHSFAFTSGVFPDPLRIKPRNRVVTEDACRRCHQPVVETIDRHGGGAEGVSCVRCHAQVGHMR